MDVELDAEFMNDFHAAAAAPGGEASTPPTFRAFLRRHRRWWLLPLIACGLLYAVLIGAFLTSSVPFIYTIF